MQITSLIAHTAALPHGHGDLFTALAVACGIGLTVAGVLFFRRAQQTPAVEKSRSV